MFITYSLFLLKSFQRKGNQPHMCLSKRFISYDSICHGMFDSARIITVRFLQKQFCIPVRYSHYII